MTDEHVKQLYSGIAPNYEKIAIEKAGYTAYLKVPQRVLELLKGTQHPKILDLGCGTGLSSKIFLDEGFDVTGIDVAPGMIEEAGKKPFSKLICQSIEDDLNVSDDTFDAVIALGALEFIRSPEALLTKIWSKLKRHGICAITVPQKLPSDSVMTFANYTREEFVDFVAPNRFDLLEVMDFFGFESGSFSELDPRFTPVRERIEYWAFLLRKK